MFQIDEIQHLMNRESGSFHMGGNEIPLNQVYQILEYFRLDDFFYYCDKDRELQGGMSPIICNIFLLFLANQNEYLDLILK